MKTYQKYDVATIYASKLAEKNDAALVDITISPKATKNGALRVIVSQEAEDGWNDVSPFFTHDLPTPEDIEALRGKKVVDVFIQRGWNEDKKAWGAPKVIKFVLEGGEEITLNGGKVPFNEGDAE